MLRRLLVLIVIFLLIAPVLSNAGRRERVHDSSHKICDARADFFLGIEDDPMANRFHQQRIAHDPQNALAHYHLGFAYGMVGRSGNEIVEYERAVQLGLTDWTLWLNLGLAYFEQRDPHSAADALRVAVLIAPEHPETHYNLALVYDRLHMLREAEQQALTAYALDSSDLDIGNTLAVIRAERGEFALAREEWSELLAHDSGYAPAKMNLAILDDHAAKATALKSDAGNTSEILAASVPDHPIPYISMINSRRNDDSD